jgi:hypothetical protein
MGGVPVGVRRGAAHRAHGRARGLTRVDPPGAAGAHLGTPGGATAGRLGCASLLAVERGASGEREQKQGRGRTGAKGHGVRSGRTLRPRGLRTIEPCIRSAIPCGARRSATSFDRSGGSQIPSVESRRPAPARSRSSQRACSGARDDSDATHRVDSMCRAATGTPCAGRPPSALRPVVRGSEPWRTPVRPHGKTGCRTGGCASAQHRRAVGSCLARV